MVALQTWYRQGCLSYLVDRPSVRYSSAGAPRAVIYWSSLQLHFCQRRRATTAQGRHILSWCSTKWCTSIYCCSVRYRRPVWPCDRSDLLLCQRKQTPTTTTNARQTHIGARHDSWEGINTLIWCYLLRLRLTPRLPSHRGGGTAALHNVSPLRCHTGTTEPLLLSTMSYQMLPR